MAKNQKTNRDHAKKTARPMVEDETIASQLSALLTPAITSQENYYRQLGLRGRILNLPLMVAAVLTLRSARRSWSNRTHKNAGKRRFFMVPTYDSHSTSYVSKVSKFSRHII